VSPWDKLWRRKGAGVRARGVRQEGSARCLLSERFDKKRNIRVFSSVDKPRLKCLKLGWIFKVFVFKGKKVKINKVKFPD
jgi:hypothetical protein